MEIPYNGLRAVLFDFDGTLTQPGGIDFALVRKAVGCPEGAPILEYIDKLPSSAQRKTARSVLHRMEMAAAANAKPNRDAEDLLIDLKAMGLFIGIVSRNSRASITRALENFKRIEAVDFDVIVPRDLALKPKPNPAPILHAADTLEISVARILMVGDYVFDIQAGKAAGVLTVLITNQKKVVCTDVRPDYTIDRLCDLKALLKTTPGPT